MRRTAILSACLFLTTAACNGSVGATGGAGGTGLSGSSTAVTSGTGATTGGATVTLTLDSFTVPAGAEVYKCQDFANPFGGKDAEIGEFESHMAAGSHHMLLFYKQGATDSALEDCSGLEFAATPYGSQTLNDSLSFPPGVAALIPGSDGLRIQSHYLNTTMSTINAHVEVIFHLAAPGSVMNQAGVLFVVDTDIDVPPAASTLNSDACTIPLDMNMIRASSHMHRHGTNFTATVNGDSVYDTTAWSDPVPAEFAPPKVFQTGDPLYFACTFDNNGTTPLTFGESALTNEMCIFTASFYPTPPGIATIDASGCTTNQVLQGP
jgi:Copper type II ascorbate-dependent monooxygenase, C-terminal domain